MNNIKNNQNTPIAIENHRKGFYRKFNSMTAEEKEARRQIIIKSWADPIKRANRVNALRKSHSSVEARKNHSQATKDFLAKPENLEARKKLLKETWAKPENKIKLEKIIQIGLKATRTTQAIENHRKAQQKPELKKARSDRAKKRMKSMLENRNIYSKLNEFLRLKLMSVDLLPEKEYPIGPYLVDFCFPQAKLVIEADGDFWHANPAFIAERGNMELYPVQKKMQFLDKTKNSYLKNHGWTILRFWERDIYKNTGNCIEKIQNTLKDIICQ